MVITEGTPSNAHARMGRFWRDDAGQGLVEYALIVTLVALAVFGSAALLGGHLLNSYTNDVASITAAGG